MNPFTPQDMLDASMAYYGVPYYMRGFSNALPPGTEGRGKAPWIVEAVYGENVNLADLYTNGRVTRTDADNLDCSGYLAVIISDLTDGELFIGEGTSQQRSYFQNHGVDVTPQSVTADDPASFFRDLSPGDVVYFSSAEGGGTHLAVFYGFQETENGQWPLILHSSSYNQAVGEYGGVALAAWNPNNHTPTEAYRFSDEVMIAGEMNVTLHTINTLEQYSNARGFDTQALITSVTQPAEIDESIQMGVSLGDGVDVVAESSAFLADATLLQSATGYDLPGFVGAQDMYAGSMGLESMLFLLRVMLEAARVKSQKGTILVEDDQMVLLMHACGEASHVMRTEGQRSQLETMRRQIAENQEILTDVDFLGELRLMLRRANVPGLIKQAETHRGWQPSKDYPEILQKALKILESYADSVASEKSRI